MSDGSLEGIDLANTDLRDARFDDAFLYDVRFAGSDMTGASFRDTVILAGSFTVARLVEASFEGAHLTAAPVSALPGAARPVLRPGVAQWKIRSDLIAACLTKANFTDATLDDIDLTYADGARVKFTGATLSDIKGRLQTTLRDADLSNARGAPSNWSQSGYSVPRYREQPACNKTTLPGWLRG